MLCLQLFYCVQCQQESLIMTSQALKLQKNNTGASLPLYYNINNAAFAFRKELDPNDFKL